MSFANWHHISIADICSRLDVNIESGLDREKITERLETYGPNTLPEPGRRSLWRVVPGQFSSPLIYILFVAAIIAFVSGHSNDSIVILVVVILNAIIGTIQEGRAERSMEALRRLSSLQVRVIRDGCEELIEAGNLVPGDVIVLTAGDAIGADARLIEEAALEVAEAALTGESLPVAKGAGELSEDTLLADRDNMLYSGTHVAAGRGRAVVVATQVVS